MQRTGKYYIKLAIPDGVAFPTHTSIDTGSLFYRNDERLLYVYSGEWYPVPTYAGTPNVDDVLSWDGNYWIPGAVTASGSGATTFVGLTDTPSSYTSYSGYFVQVVGAEDALRFGGANAVLNALLTVDGDGSGLDADKLDGRHADLTPEAYQIPIIDGNSELILPGKVQLAATSGGVSDGYLWNDDTQDALQTYVNGTEQTLAGCIFTQTADKTVSNTTIETSIIGTGVGTVSLPANFLLAGKTIRGIVRGYNSTASSAGTLVYKVKLGSNTIMATSTQAAGNSYSNMYWELQFEITCRAAGVPPTGQVYGQGLVQRASTTVLAAQWQMVSTSVVTINTTSAYTLDVTVQWGTASSSNTMTSTNAVITILN